MNFVNNKKILRNSYIPTKPKLYNEQDKGDLDTRLQQADYGEIISNTDKYFEKVNIINFDLLHHRCRGDIFFKLYLKKRSTLNLIINYKKTFFFSSAQRCECKDVYFEKDSQKDHFNRTFVKDELKKRGIFLSSMQKRRKCTDECKSLSF